MALKTPIVLVNGELAEMQAGDSVALGTEFVKRTEIDASAFGFALNEPDMISNSDKKFPTQHSVRQFVNDRLGGQPDSFRKIEKVITGVNVVALCYHKVAWDDDPDWIEKQPAYAHPAESVAIATAGKVAIFDLTDPECPISKEFIYPGETISAAKFCDGYMFVGTGSGVIAENLVTGERFKYTTASTPAIVDNAVNDLAVTLLDAAAINPALI